jgi:DNA polymerase-1
MRDVLYDAPAVKDKFGVTPTQIVDYLALTGDSSDNVPGVKGIGPKSAAQLLQHFGTIEELVKRSAEIEQIPGLRGAKRTKNLIESGLDMLRLSQDLVRLDPEVPSTSGVNSAEEFLWNGPNEEGLAPLLAELEFESLLKQVVGPVAPKSTRSSTDLSYNLVTNENFEQWASELEKQDLLAFDTETTSLDVVEAELAGISVSWADNSAWYLPLISQVDPSSCLKLERVRGALDPFFRDPSKLKIGFNLKYDISVLLKYGFGFAPTLFDSMLASYVLDPDGRQHGLKPLAKSLLGEEMATYEETLGDKSCITEVKLERVAQYAGHDADASLKLYRVFDEKLGAADTFDSPNGQRKVFEELEMPLVPVLAKMELAGIKIDVPFFKRLGKGVCRSARVLRAKSLRAGWPRV